MTVSVSIPASEAPAVAPEQTNTSAVERPANVPEKFWDSEAGTVRTDALIASYTELEGRLGSQPQQTQQAAQPTDAQVEQTLAQGGLKLSDFDAEYLQNGKLSDESYAKLATVGLSKADVDEYISFKEAKADAEVQAVFNEIGGESEFRKVQAWARANLPPAYLSAFNEIVDSGSADALKLAVSGLQSRYVAANGREPKLVGGQPGANAEGFRSNAEIIKAMSDPRYRKDEAYRADVTARLAVTPF